MPLFKSGPILIPLPTEHSFQVTSMALLDLVKDEYARALTHMLLAAFQVAETCEYHAVD